MSEEKYCPLKFKREGLGKIEGSCVGSLCAWWVDTKTRQQCAVAEVTIILDWIRRGYKK